jgi:outer membrane protein OmpA-like peptidoglycan-associated protein/tetratricopeptide (TPR) repeat protein
MQIQIYKQIMKKTLPLLCLTLLLSFCSEEKKLLRKASNAVDRSEFDKAITYYDQIIKKDDNSFYGNAGKGIVLSEFQAKHEQAIPYLEKALANSPDKSKPILHGDLGQSYHFIGNYKRALFYYGKINNDPKFNDYDEFLSKRIADCKYAMEHPEIATTENQDLKNIGGPINTDKPEYTPVYSNGTMYFTSKRQDDPKEKKNGIDGKYFEGVYVSKLENGSWSAPKQLDLPKGFHSRKFGQAVTSISPDGQKLFLYKGGKLYETDVNKSDDVKELDSKINFSRLQNHAALSPDGKTMYFTSEAERGAGGSDIYISTKKDDGSWSEPRSLGGMINTQYDEEAPFITSDGVLYFASNGHPGYGGFDIYKTKQVNGTWMKPENLGQPINSPGDDIFFTLMNNSSKGYYASARPGGFGDLDIYQVHYVRTENVECKPTEQLAISATPDLNNPLAYTIKLDMPDAFKSSIRSYRWEMNGQALAHTGDNFQHTFSKPDNYKITARVTAYCDTCPTLNAFCAEKNLAIESNILAKNETEAKNENDLANNSTGKNKKNKKDSKNKSGTGSEDVTGDNDNNAVASNNEGSKSKKNKNKGTTANDGATDNSQQGADNNAVVSGKDKNDNGRSSDYNSLSNSFMSDEKLKEIQWNVSPVYFDYNASELRNDAKSILDANIDILKKQSNLSVVITGYADSRGTAEYNKQLSSKRAKSVKEYLVNNGVSSKQIKGTKALGESELVNNCSDNTTCDDSQHQQNRRVKLNVIDSKHPITLK